MFITLLGEFTSLAEPGACGLPGTSTHTRNMSTALERSAKAMWGLSFEVDELDGVKFLQPQNENLEIGSQVVLNHSRSVWAWKGQRSNESKRSKPEGLKLFTRYVKQTGPKITHLACLRW